MRRSLLTTLAVGALWAAPALSTAGAQSSTRIEIQTDRDGNMRCYRNGRRIDCDDIRADRDRALERAREAREARERAAEVRERARERADEARRRAEETRRWELDRLREQRERVDREREYARVRVVQAPRRFYDDLRPRVTVGGGADIRRFDDVNRYVVAAGVDFHSSFGIGVRPEVVYAWSDRQREQLPAVVCAACTANQLGTVNTTAVELRSRSQMLGVNLNATYSFLRRSMVRPYVLGGIGVLSTREAFPIVASTVPLVGNPQITTITYRTETRDHVDVGLNTGAGMEFGRGPVRLFTEFRYFLTDTPTTRGFSGMLPITAGLRF
jgi:opacity protein-like surface antigen